MKRKKTGFTMVEILTVVGIIAILVAVLVPTLSMVRRIAKETQQKAQLTAIELALTAFKSDYGDYPPSDFLDKAPYDYCGAQMLAEALLGWDLLGFHPKSEWRSDGKDDFGTEIYHKNPDPTNDDDLKNLKERRGPYLDVTNTNVFKLGRTPGKRDGLFVVADTLGLAEQTYVICDVFGTKLVTLTDGKTVRAGTPILYYRANTASKRMESSDLPKNIYNAYDNYALIKVVTNEKKLSPEEEKLTLASTASNFKTFRDFISDPRATTPTITWPYRADSYILISAGADGLYGTEDDICNF